MSLNSACICGVVRNVWLVFGRLTAEKCSQRRFPKVGNRQARGLSLACGLTVLTIAYAIRSHLRIATSIRRCRTVWLSGKRFPARELPAD